MNAKLQQAIQATRTGDKQQAQLLLTEILKENPQEAQAWFLLSHLVDSEQKQVAYLSKVLALNPTHEKAKQRLARLKSAVSTPIPSTPTQVITPPAEKTPPPTVEEPKTVIKPVQPITPPPVKVAAEKPAPTVQTPPTPTAVTKPPVASPPTPKPTPAIPKPPMSKKALAAQAVRKKQQQRYNFFLRVLGILAVIVFVILILWFLAY